MRLYGGWYEQHYPTRKAHDLETDIQVNFPRRMNITKNGDRHSLIIIVEIAYALCIDPRTHLFSTYRPRGIHARLRCHHPNALGCNDPSCPLIDVYNFISTGSCNTQCCNISSEDMIYRGEQKLVDTMVVCDMIHLAEKEDRVILVSSDDDFWPGIKTAIIMGTHIIHIHTRNRHVPTYYSGNIGQSNYSQRIM